MTHRAQALGVLLCLMAAALPTFAQTAAQAAPAAATLEALFRAQPYRGEPAKEPKFSRSGRYLANLWAPFGEPGSDLYVHDTRSGQTQRLSSPQLMTAFDTPEDLARFDTKLAQRNREWAQRQAQEVAQAAYLRGDSSVNLSAWEQAEIAILKQEAADKFAKDEAQKALDKAAAEVEKRAMAELVARRAGKPLPPEAAASAAAPKPAVMPEKEDWEWRDELKKKLAKNKLKPTDLYPGVTQIEWAHERDELIVQYRGHLLRWQAGPDLARTRLTPLVSAPRPLRIVDYTRDDQGFIYQDDGRLLRARFNAAGVHVLNRELVHPDDAERKYKIEATTLSEDGRWMALTARAPLGEEGKPPPKPGRQVEIMGYGERFAAAKKVDRELPDDKRMVQPTAIYIRPVPAGPEAPAKQPEAVFTHVGGDVWLELSPVAFSRDGSHYSFTTWEREKELLRVYLGRSDSSKPEVVLERRGDVGHEVVSMLRPQFTPDGRQLVVVLDEHGFRQPYAYQLADKSLKRLVQGDFEAHTVLGFTPDSQAMFVLANKDDFAAMNLYRVDLKTQAMQALGAAPDYHRNAAVAFDGTQAAAVAGHWGERPELKLLRANQPAKVLTQSHDPAFAQVHLLRPERLSIKNRHGDTLHAYWFKPPGWQASDKRPAVVYVYGGPLNDRHTVETDSFQPTAYLFAQYMAARHGYVMVAVDTRGHSNYGRRFSGANWEQVGVPQTEDLADLHAHIAANLGVDSQRIGLNGWSFGGFQTQHTLFTQPDLYAAGIAGAGPTEWENYNSWYSGRTIGPVVGKSGERSKAPVLRRYSLLPLARNLKRPLMLVHGMQDPNVLFQDTVNVYRALLESGKESLVELFLDPDGEHGMGGAVKTAGWHRKYEAFWLERLGRVRP